MSAADPSKPVLLRRVIRRGGGHGHRNHSWKVAYADFVTAMMAFFLLLWLIGTAGEKTLEGLANYFSDTEISILPPGGLLSWQSGAGGQADLLPHARAVRARRPEQPQASSSTSETLDGTQLRVEMLAGMPGNGRERANDDPRQAKEDEAAEGLRAAIIAELEDSVDGAALKDGFTIQRVPEGLKIELLDRQDYAMFPLGSDAIYPHTRDLIHAVAKAIGPLPQALSITGHTDSLPFAAGAGSDNWRLSAARANATRLALIEGGVDPDRVQEIVGKADAELAYPANPYDPRNRRISILLLTHPPQSPTE
jgi:chemotaxis protein MotB